MAAPREFQPVTNEHAVTEYERHLDRRVAGGSLSATTRASYLRDLYEHVALTGPERLIDDVDTDDLDDAVLAWSQRPDLRRNTPKPGGKSTNTLTRHVGSIRAFYAWAALNGYVRRNPTEGMAVRPKPIKVDGRRRAPSSENVEALESSVERSGWRAEFLQVRDELMLRILLECGPRVSELCAMDTADLAERSDGWWIGIRNGKGGKARDVPVSASTAQLARGDYARLRPPPWPKDSDDRQRDSSRALLHSVRGRRLAPRDVQLSVEKAARRAGFSCVPHSLRHYVGTALINDNHADVATVARLLGHASPAITAQAYLDDLSPALRRAVDGIAKP